MLHAVGQMLGVNQKTQNGENKQGQLNRDPTDSLERMPSMPLQEEHTPDE